MSNNSIEAAARAGPGAVGEPPNWDPRARRGPVRGSNTLRPWFRSGIPDGFLLVAPAGWINQQQRDVIDYLQEENRVLREQLGPQRLRFTNDQRIRLAAKAKTLGRRALTEIRSIVTPDTLLAWHRALIARNCDGHLRRRAGTGRAGPRRRSASGSVRMATENRSWSYSRIQGALANLDHHVRRGTIASILKRVGSRPPLSGRGGRHGRNS